MANIGSAEWFTEQADKVINVGLGVLQTKLQGVDSTSGSTPGYVTIESSATKYLPYVIGAVVVGGIVLILAKR